MTWIREPCCAKSVQLSEAKSAHLISLKKAEIREIRNEYLDKIKEQNQLISWLKGRHELEGEEIKIVAINNYKTKDYKGRISDKNKRVIAYTINSIIDNNNDILSRSFSKYQYAHDAYSSWI